MSIKHENGCVFDLNSRLPYFFPSPEQKGWAHELWTDRLCLTDGLFAFQNHRVIRPAVPGRVSGPIVLLLGPVPVLGLRPDHRLPEPAGHRGLTHRAARAAVSSGDLEAFRPQLPSRIQRVPRLADLHRLRPGIDPPHPSALSRAIAPGGLLRRGKQLPSYHPRLQLRLAAADRCIIVQVPLADRDLLQMDQIQPADRALPRHVSQRGQAEDLGRHHRARPGNRVKHQLNLPNCFHEILQILKMTVFKKVPLVGALTKVEIKDNRDAPCNSQKSLNF